MHSQQRACFFIDGIFVVRELGAIRGPNFAQERPALLHDFRNAETVANFDQFAARDDHFAAARQCREHNKNSGGAIVDHDRRFRAG